MSNKILQKRKARLRRKNRVRAKVVGTSARPRLVVFRSLNNIWSQIIDDSQGNTLCSASNKGLKAKGTKTEQAALVGQEIAKKAQVKKISKVVFDKSSYKYHGRVKALAEAARKAGLEF